MSPEPETQSKQDDKN